MPRPMKFLLPAIFLCLLGAGNIGVGLYKSAQYEQVVEELSASDPTPVIVSSSPLRRLQLAKEMENRNYQQRKKAEAKLDFYRLVTFGGQVFMGISFFLFVVSSLLQVIRQDALDTSKAAIR